MICAKILLIYEDSEVYEFELVGLVEPVVLVLAIFSLTLYYCLSSTVALISSPENLSLIFEDFED